MYVKSLEFKNYRNYDHIKLELNENLNIFLGENAQGKTNIAEAVYFLSALKSHRTSKNKEVIKWDFPDSYIKGVINKEYGEDTIEIFLSTKEKNYIKVNGVKVNKASQILGKLNVVMFSPEDLKLIKEGPVGRRRFLDYEISQIRPKYHYLNNQYNKILIQRNNLLKSIQFKPSLIDTLDVFTDQLINIGSEIILIRSEFINRLALISKHIHSKITNGSEELFVSYSSDVKKFDNIEDIRKLLKVYYNKNRENEIKKGYTLIGPHRDDMCIKINNVDVRSFGSQGQQRSAALSLKLSELKIIKSLVGEYPVLILDDVLSELDEIRQKHLIEEFKDVQTILTCTSASDVDMFSNEKKDVYIVKKGKLDKINI